MLFIIKNFAHSKASVNGMDIFRHPFKHPAKQFQSLIRKPPGVKYNTKMKEHLGKTGIILISLTDKIKISFGNSRIVQRQMKKPQAAIGKGHQVGQRLGHKGIFET